MFASCFDRGPASGGKRRTRRGFVLLTAAAMVFLVLMPAIGLAIDAGMMYLVQSRLYAAVDAASLAGARALARGIDDNAQHSNAEATATIYFNANFPDRLLRDHQRTRHQRGGHRLDVHALGHQHGKRRSAVHLPARAGRESYDSAGFGKGDAARRQYHDRDGPVEIARRQRSVHTAEGGRGEVRG